MKSKGFTLIELLVAVAIIGVLAAIVLSSLNSARIKARDARRDSDIKTIQTALEMYYLDHGEYPTQISWGGVAPGSQYANSGNSSWETLETVMGITLPRDPVNEVPVTNIDYAGGTGKKFNYAYIGRGIIGCAAGQAYILIYRHEQGDVPVSENPGVKRCSDGAIQRHLNGSISIGKSPLQ